jgi:Domain of unknown function (DUF4157)/Protein of unknown function (DUF1402)
VLIKYLLLDKIVLSLFQAVARQHKFIDTSASTIKQNQEPGYNYNNKVASKNRFINLFNSQFVPKPYHSSVNFSFASIQTKLKVSQPGDIYEQEADRIAHKALSIKPIAQTSTILDNIDEKINCKCSGCKGEGKNEETTKISRRENPPVNSSTKFDIPNGSAIEIDNTLSQSGSPLDSSTREFMESRFGYDFDDVKIHSDVQSSELADSINALACTIGENIMFGYGQYAPNSTDGQKLLAHELTHVVQQRALSSNIQNNLPSRYLDHSTESIINSNVQNIINYNQLPIMPIQAWESSHIIFRNGVDEYPATVPRIISITDDVVTVININGVPERVSKAEFALAWYPGNAGNPSVLRANEAYKRAWQEITGQHQLDISFELASAATLQHVSTDLPTLSEGEMHVLAWLRKYKLDIEAAENSSCVDRRAIAGAIAWEALENVKKFSLRAAGPGKVHYKTIFTGTTTAEQVEKAGYIAQRTDEVRKEILSKPEGAITYIAAIMRADADAIAVAGYDIYRDPAMLANFYNAWTLQEIKVHAQRLIENRKVNEPLIPLTIGNKMGYWVRDHLRYLESGVGKPSYLKPECKLK